MSAVYLATLHTEHFTFSAVAYTRAVAVATLKAGWAAHVAQVEHTGGLGLYTWRELRGDVDVQRLELHRPYRDGLPIGGK